MWLDFVIGGLVLVIALGVHMYRLGEQHGREEQMALAAVECSAGACYQRSAEGGAPYTG